MRKSFRSAFLSRAFPLSHQPSVSLEILVTEILPPFGSMRLMVHVQPVYTETQRPSLNKGCEVLALLFIVVRGKQWCQTNLPPSWWALLEALVNSCFCYSPLYVLSALHFHNLLLFCSYFRPAQHLVGEKADAQAGPEWRREQRGADGQEHLARVLDHSEEFLVTTDILTQLRHYQKRFSFAQLPPFRELKAFCSKC